MNIVVLGTKGTAVTTTALALASAWTTDNVAVIELDSAGGDIASRFDLASAPGLVTAAASAREPAALFAHTQLLAGNIRVIAAPVLASEAQGAIVAVSRGLLPMSQRDATATFIVDVGRVDPEMLPDATISADLAVVCLRQDPRARGLTVAHAVHTRRLVEVLANRGVPIVVAVVGSAPFAPSELLAFLGQQATVALADDPFGASLLAGHSRSSRLRSKSRLLLSAVPLVQAVVKRLPASRSTALPPPTLAMRPMVIR